MTLLSNSSISYIRLKAVENICQPSFHTAKWVMIDPENIIENGCIEVDNSKIVRVFKIGVGSDSRHILADRRVNYGAGVLMPAMVNAHLHLELSALKGRLPLGIGFRSWVEALLKERQNLGVEKLTSEASKAALSLYSLGIGRIGEISTLGITKKIVANTELFGIWFQEILATANPELTLYKDQKSKLSFSLAGHAPHTTDPDLLSKIKYYTNKQRLPFSIHLAESPEEKEFLETGQGEWKEFLAERGIDVNRWPIGGRSPVEYLNYLGLLDPLTICVHILHADHSDFDLLVNSGAKVCLCPRSNYNLYGLLPNIPAMLNKGITPALGTDSLASSTSLSIFDEMAYVSRSFPEIPPSKILAMATINGAAALGQSLMAGALAPEKLAEFIYINITAANKTELSERLVFNELH